MRAHPLLGPVAASLLVAMATVAAPAQVTPAAAADTVPLYDDLGSHHYGISSIVPLVQEYFDQGLRLYYAFNHAESIRAFQEAARRDPSCAICYWGIGIAYGPNINAPMDEAAGALAHEAVQAAIRHEPHASGKESALIRALSVRYSADPGAPRPPLDSAYAREMERLVAAHPDDIELKVLLAEAIMNLSPWYYWTKEGEPRPQTPVLLEQLETTLRADPDHPGACHFYIHAVEEAHPERAVECAERLAALMPGAGHIVHMPAHIYIRVGRYLDAIEANEHAVHADETYIRDQSPGMGIYPLLYYPHNYDFLAFAATMAGRGEQALHGARRVEALIPADILTDPELGGVFQHYSTVPLRLLVRLGRWEEIARVPQPAEELSFALATWHFAQGMAKNAIGDAAASASHLERLESMARDPGLADVGLVFNPAAPILEIAAQVLAGEIAAARGDTGTAVDHLRRAAAAEDELTYGEPPDWPVPVRHHLGAVLLAHGDARQAERVYREDLQRFPENGWALFGLAESLRAQRRDAEAAEVEARFQRAWAGADVTLHGSRF
jgi:tetratricopeptide (TPR) repeat protein